MADTPRLYRIRALSMLVVATLYFTTTGQSCKTSDVVDPAADPCDDKFRVLMQHTKVLRTPEIDTLDLTTPPANKECHARYSIIYRWADPARAAVDKSEPALYVNFNRLPGAWQGSDGDAHQSVDQSTDLYMWVRTYENGAKDLGADYANYYLYATPSSLEAKDSVLVLSASLSYVPN